MGVVRARSWLAPTYVQDHQRRLNAYKILEAYFRNCARDWLDTDDETLRNERREFGDAALLVKTVKAALLGDDVSIVVEDAGESGDNLTAEQRAANERQEWLDDWSEQERFRAVLDLAETDAVKLGDGVYVLGWDPERQRVRVENYDPGFYFPYLDPRRSSKDFPGRIDIAWTYEMPVDDRGGVEEWVHRITWELRPVEPYRTKWGDRPATVSCFMTEGDWKLSDIGQRKVHQPWPKGQYLLDAEGERLDRDLRLDFIPVVHEPNTVAGAEHFGESILTAVSQILDELSAADTDTAKAAALACVPMLGLSGQTAAGSASTVKAGAVFTLGEGGRLDVVDLANSLKAAMDYRSSQRDLLSEMSRVPAEVLGRVKASEIAAGIIMALSFGPLRSLVEEGRLVRMEKLPLLLKMVQRISWAAGVLDGPPLRAEVHFGSFLPSDQKATIDAVIALYAAHLVSRETAIRRLVEEGVVDVELAEELTRCQEEDFEAALELFEALGSSDSAREAVYDLLGREMPEEPEPQPQPQINPQTGNPLIALGGPGAAQQNRQEPQ